MNANICNWCCLVGDGNKARAAHHRVFFRFTPTPIISGHRPNGYLDHRRHTRSKHHGGEQGITLSEGIKVDDTSSIIARALGIIVGNGPGRLPKMLPLGAITKRGWGQGVWYSDRGKASQQLIPYLQETLTISLSYYLGTSGFRKSHLGR